MIKCGYSVSMQTYWYRRDMVFMRFRMYLEKGGVRGMAEFSKEAKAAMKRVNKKGSKKFSKARKV
jgi:hypothetical protein